MAVNNSEAMFIELSSTPLRFEPVSKVINVFFDEVNKQVFAVRSRGATGVIVSHVDGKYTHGFRMSDKGEVISIKFSYDQKILAVQRSHRCVEFINFTDKEMDSVEYSQSCKGKTTRIIGFNWTNTNDIVFITDHGLELYQVLSAKKALKSIKSFNLTVNWFVFSPESSLLLLSSGSMGNVFHPFYFKQGSATKLPKFEVDLPVVPKQPKSSLPERDVTIANLYGQVYAVVLKHQSRGSTNTGAEIVLYQLQRESPAKKTDLLKLNMSGRFAVNVVENLVMVHHQASKTSLIFDIKLGGYFDGYTRHHQPAIPAMSIKPFTLKLTEMSHEFSQLMSQPGAAVTQIPCELYSPNWVVFQPNIVIDAKLGYLWTVHLRLENVVHSFHDKCLLTDFLLLRSDSKSVILSVCKTVLAASNQQEGSLQTIAKIFDKLNTVYKSYQEEEQNSALAEPGAIRTGRRGHQQAIVEQSDMYTHVFSIFTENKKADYKFVVAVLVEYIRSLNHLQIPVQHFLYELVITALVHHNCFYQLHQFLQYHVLSDSKPLACLMLSLESHYPPAYQLALDMLKRLATANEEIIEVLLSKQHLLAALKFVRSVGIGDTVPARKFLEVALQTNDDMLFYSVYKFFEQRNMQLKGTPRFSPGDHCEEFVKHFISLYGEDSLAQLI